MSWDDRSRLVGRYIPSLKPHSESGPSPFWDIPPPPRDATGRPEVKSMNPRTRLEFTDGRGRRWRRTPDGHRTAAGEVARGPKDCSGHRHGLDSRFSRATGRPAHYNHI